MAWWNEGVFNTPVWRFASLGLNFTCQKYITIKDWRVGLLHRVLQAAVMFYVLYQFFTLKSYLEIETPEITFQTLGTGGADFYPAQTKAMDNPPIYCTNASMYETFLPAREDFTAITPRCDDMDWPMLVESSGQDSVFVETFRMESVRRTIFNVTSPEGCPPASTFPTGPEEGFTGIRGPFFKASKQECQYVLQKHDIPLVPESVAVGFGFSYALPPRFNASGTSKDLTCKCKQPSGNTTVLGTVSQNQLYIQAPLQQWLEYVGVSLDKDIGQLGDEGIIDLMDGFTVDSLPMTRVTGMTLNIDVKLYNNELQPYGDSNEDGIACIIEAKPTLFWRNGPTAVYKVWGGDNKIVGFGSIETFGILVAFSGGGSFGALNWTLAINTLVAGLVLLSVAELAVSGVSAFLLGVRSPLYEKFIFEKVDYMREYARYACQCLVAAEFFKAKDADVSGTLGRDEIYSSLSNIFAEQLEENEIAALADFIMKTGDRSAMGLCSSAETSAEEDSQLTLEQWFNCFTQDICSLKSLHDILHAEYNTEKKLADVNLKALDSVRSIRGSQFGASTENVFLSVRSLAAEASRQEATGTATASTASVLVDASDENDNNTGEDGITSGEDGTMGEGVKGEDGK